MSGDQIANLLYLTLLGAALISWNLIPGRAGLSKSFQQLAAWAMIFLGTVAVIGLWQDVRDTVMPRQSVFGEEGRIELPRAPDGHYYVTLDVNGAPVRFVVDTGATSVVLTEADARKAGIDLDRLVFLSRAMTANGAVQTAPVTLDRVALGPITDDGLPAYVNGGSMDTSLLGMTYLNRFDSLAISNGKMVLQR